MQYYICRSYASSHIVMVAIISIHYFQCCSHCHGGNTKHTLFPVLFTLSWWQYKAYTIPSAAHIVMVAIQSIHYSQCCSHCHGGNTKHTLFPLLLTLSWWQYKAYTISIDAFLLAWSISSVHYCGRKNNRRWWGKRGRTKQLKIGKMMIAERYKGRK